MESRDFELIDRAFCVLTECESRHGSDSLDETEQVVLRVWHASGIIGNGGFRYFFECGLPLAATAEDYSRIGVERATKILRDLLELFPGRHVPDDLDERLQLVDRLYQAHPSLLYRWERDYFETDDLMEKQLAGWIRVHNDVFQVSRLS